MYVKPPLLLKLMMPWLSWDIKTDEKVIYLTFDDGPHPEITPQVLDILDTFKASATFFCVGENVQKYPLVFTSVIDRGHRVGNHTYNHLKGWNTDNKAYYANIEKADKLIASNLFRPPHGLITPRQAWRLKKKYRLIMWSVISYDFSQQISPEQCLENVLKHSRPGTIAVFHDSEKSAKNMLAALPLYLRTMTERGYRFRAIDQ
ncbi:MAG: polysaccharide deacetylase family protein [Bacteroidetes bacterium]|nr:polysaccharide deacetylase family protein [Bacteroidota bacterium]